MELPLQISFRGMDTSPATEALIRERAEKLDRFHDRITGCRVVVEAHHRHQRKGRIYHVRVDVTVPGHEIVVGREPDQHHAHEDIKVAVRDAFDAMRRQLEDRLRVDDGAVKTSAQTEETGRVARLFPDYGFIESGQRGDVYFHRNSVVRGGFDKLEAGDRVRFVLHEGEGEKGPQASTVAPLPRPRS